MAQVTLKLSLTPKWWFRPALALVAVALWLDLIPDADSAEHIDGRITGSERAARWLADFAFAYEVRHAVR